MNKKEYSKMLSSYPSAMKAAEVAEVLRVSTKTVYKLVRENRIPSVKVGREIRIAKSELINYLRQRDVKSPQTSEPDNTQKYVWTLANLCGIVRVGHNTMTHQNTKGEADYGCQKNTGCKRSGLEGQTVCCHSVQGKRQKQICLENAGLARRHCKVQSKQETA